MKTKQRNDDREDRGKVSKIQTPMCDKHIKLMWKGFSRLGKKTSISKKISNSYVILKKNQVGQAIKSVGRMTWHQEPKKDVTSCDKLRLGANIH